MRITRNGTSLPPEQFKELPSKYSRIGRISANQAEELLGVAKNHELGSVSTLKNNYDKLDLFDLPTSINLSNDYLSTCSISDLRDSVQSLLDDAIYSFGPTGDDDLRIIDDLSDYLKKVNRAMSISGYVSMAKELKENHDNSDANSKPVNNIQTALALNSYITDFERSHPESNLDICAPGSVDGINNFIKYYNNAINSERLNEHYIEVIDNARKLLIEELNSNRMKSLLGGQKNVKRIASIFEDRPVLISDPLDAFYNFAGSNTEPYGWYVPAERVCYIDPFTISRSIDNSGEAADKELIIKTTLVLAHELLHATANNLYRVKEYENADTGEYNDSSDMHLKYTQIWPKFINEAMVEKLAYTLTVDALGKDFESFSIIANTKNNTTKINESMERSLGSDNPREVINTLKDSKMRDFVPSSYIHYRLLLDNVLEKADWTKAGITQKKAESLLIKAFFMGDEDSPSQNTSYRKEFMKAINTATYPGFLNKLGRNVDNFGSTAMLNVMESPNFNISDSSNLTFLASREFVKNLEFKASKLDQAVETARKLKELDASKELLDKSRDLVMEKIIAEELLGDYEVALSSLRKIYKVKYGSRRRLITPSVALYWALFEKGSISDYNFPKKVDPEKLELWGEDVSAWLDTREDYRTGNL